MLPSAISEDENNGFKRTSERANERAFVPLVGNLEACVDPCQMVYG